MESDCTDIMNKSHIHGTLIGSQFNEECEYNNFYIRMTSIKCRCIVTSPLQMEMGGVHLIEALCFFSLSSVW